MKKILSQVQVTARLKTEQDYHDFLTTQYDNTVDGKNDLIADINSDRDREAKSRKAVFYTLGIVSLLSTLRAAVGASINNNEYNTISNYAEVTLGAIAIVISYVANSVANETKASQDALQAVRDYSKKIGFFPPAVMTNESKEEACKPLTNLRSTL